MTLAALALARRALGAGVLGSFVLTVAVLAPAAVAFADVSMEAFAAAEAVAAAAAVPVAAESLAAFPPPSVRAWQVGLLRTDRLQHAGLSFTLGAAFTLAFQDRAAAAGLTLALGAGKEWWDARRARREARSGGADAMDLVADAVGVGLALVVVRGRGP